jgi:hypothetical protein
VATRTAGQPTAGPKWLLIGGIIAIVAVLAVVAFVVIAMISGGGDTEANTGGDDDPVDTVTAVATDTPTQVPTQTPVPPTPTPVPIPSLTELQAQLPVLKVAVLEVGSGLHPADQLSINQLFADTEERLDGVDPQRPQVPAKQLQVSTIDLLANALYLIVDYGCQNPTDTTTPPVFREFREYIYTLIARLQEDKIDSNPIHKDDVRVKILARMNSCQNPLMTS